MSIAFQPSSTLCTFLTGTNTNNSSFTLSSPHHPSPLRPRFIRTKRPNDASQSLFFKRQTPSCVAAPSPPQPSPSSLPVEPINMPLIIPSPSVLAPEQPDTVTFTSRNTVAATVLAFVAGCSRVLIESPSAVNSLITVLPRAGMGLLAVVLGRAFTAGIIKPLPAVNGKQLSIGTKLGIRSLSATIGLAAAWMLFPQFVFGLFAFGMCSSAVDSIPAMRLRKRFATPAAVAVSVARGIVLNLGVYQAVKSVLGMPLSLSPTVLAFSAIMTVISTVIAITRDFSSSKFKRDSARGAPTDDMSEAGTNRLVGTAHAMLSLSYAGAILAAGIAPAGLFNRTIFGVGHVLLGISLILYMTGVQPSSNKSVNGFHNFIWKLLYAEYILFPFL